MYSISRLTKPLPNVKLENLREYINFNLIILQILIVLTTIRWIPGVHPRSIRNVWKVLMVLFILYQTYAQLRDHKIVLPWIYLLSAAVLVGLGIFAYGFLTDSLIIAFGCVTVIYFYQNKNSLKIIFHTFTIWLTIVTLYSLIITFTPLSGFDMAFPLYDGYVSPEVRFSNSSIELNSFGFFGERGIYSITSVGLILSYVYYVKLNSKLSKLYLLSSYILFTQLITIYWLTGSGRAGFVLPIFFVIVMLLQKTSNESILPLVVFSPLFLWTGLYLIKDYQTVRPLLESLNNLISNRIALYFDSIQLLTSNLQSFFGWGPNPWGEYTRAEMEITNSIGSPRSMLTRPHNFLFEFMIQYGILLGCFLIYICWTVSRGTIQEIRQPTSPTRFALGVILTGTIFTGLAVGGKIGPYPINTPQMIFWWIAFGGFVSDIH